MAKTSFYLKDIDLKIDVIESKKNARLCLERNSGFYFVIGLCLVLALTYVALEWKSFDEATNFEIGYLDEPDPFNEVAPFIKPPEPPKPKFVPVIHDPISDDSDVEEDVPGFIESDVNTTIPQAPEIPEYIEPIIEETIDFIVVEEKPIFPGCEGASNKYACFQEMMQKHIRKNFRYPELAIEMNQKGKVYVQFTIQKDGSIDGIRLRGPHKLLEDEAHRIILKLPKMKPGKQRGTPVKVPFSIPIHFVLQ